MKKSPSAKNKRGLLGAIDKAKRRFSTQGVGKEAKERAARAILIPKHSDRGSTREEFLASLQDMLVPERIHSTVKCVFSVRRRGQEERERLFVIDEGIILVEGTEDNIVYFHGFPYIQSFAQAENALSGYWLPFRGEPLNFVFRFADQGTAATFSMMCLDFAKRWADEHLDQEQDVEKVIAEDKEEKDASSGESVEITPRVPTEEDEGEEGVEEEEKCEEERDEDKVDEAKEPENEEEESGEQDEKQEQDEEQEDAVEQQEEETKEDGANNDVANEEMEAAEEDEDADAAEEEVPQDEGEKKPAMESISPSLSRSPSTSSITSELSDEEALM